MSEHEFLEKILSALSKIKGKISEEGGEFDFRYSLSKYLIEDALGWPRKSGEGHFVVEKEKKDIILFDDGSPPFPIIVFETKKPEDKDVAVTKEYLATY